MLATIHPTQLSKPVGEINVQAPPLNVSINSAGEVIVTYRSTEEIAVFNEKGEKLRSSVFSDYGSKVEGVQGLVVDATNNDIFVAGYNLTRVEYTVLRLSQDLQLINIVRLKH